jgi:hypothetical protein
MIQSRPPPRDYPLDFYSRDAADAAGVMAALGFEYDEANLTSVPLTYDHPEGLSLACMPGEAQ